MYIQINLIMAVKHKQVRLTILLLTIFAGFANVAKAEDSIPIRGFCIEVPQPGEIDSFILFIEKELAPRGVNTLVLMVDYNYQFESHPEMSEKDKINKAGVKKLLKVCRKNNIRLIPLIDLLGHQSWANVTGKLLNVYPEFDETPKVKMPDTYVWPNADGLYCKSYCPLHPGLHKVLFDLIDEICDAFESDIFHAGMDEVFYIGHDSCTLCAGRDKAELFAGEVNLIRNHLTIKNRHMWIWGDRLIDGKTTGMGAWEASMNNTSRAIDLIARDVTICDWHYERPDQTPVYFAMKGLNVITCPWRIPEVAVIQAHDMVHFRETAPHEMKDRYQGLMQTVWSPTGSFLKDFYSNSNNGKNTEANCFRALFTEINKLKIN